MTASSPPFRIGIDLGGTKIEGLALAATGDDVCAGPLRVATPKDDYDGTLSAISNIVQELEVKLGITNPAAASVGIGMPGSLAPKTRLVQNANSTWLNGRAFETDLARTLRRPVRLANDANCFTLSEAHDGAGEGASSVFGVILGTGCGGGLVIDRKPIDGPLGIAGEWGHNPLPRPTADEMPGPACWCGRRGCIETWVSGPALEGLYHAASGIGLRAAQISQRAFEQHDPIAKRILAQHTERLARGLAHVINIVDPAVIVLGGGLSNLSHLYEVMPAAIAPHLFTDAPHVLVKPPRWGDSSGVRGAARLWP